MGKCYIYISSRSDICPTAKAGGPGYASSKGPFPFVLRFSLFVVVVVVLSVCIFALLCAGFLLEEMKITLVDF